MSGRNGISRPSLGLLRALWLVSLLDFFGLTMIIPSMPQYLDSAGGTTMDYYRALAVNVTFWLLSVTVVGIATDRGVSSSSILKPLCLCGIFGNALYAAADKWYALRHPNVIIIARMFVGLAAGKTALNLALLPRLVPEEQERGKWLVGFATVRSLGLFVGPTISLVLIHIAGTTEDPGGSLLGVYAMPGIFLCVTQSAAALWLFMNLFEPRPLIHALKEQGSNHESLGTFFRRPEVLAVTANMLNTGCGIALEFVIPVMCTKTLLWNPKGTSCMLMAISASVFGSQVLLLVCKVSKRVQASGVMTDLNVMYAGSGGMCITMLAVVGIWAAVIGVGSGAVATTRAHTLVAIIPFLAIEAWFPWQSNGTVMVFTRLVLEHVPRHNGICQAMCTLNSPIFGNLLLTCWLSATYSDTMIEREGLPQTALAGVAIVNLMICLWNFAVRRALKPPQPQEELKDPLLTKS